MNFNTYYVFFIIINRIFCNPTVPVLLLSNLEFNVECPAIQHITENFLKTLMRPALKLYILVEKKLSPEDFSNIRQQNRFLNTEKINYCASVTNKLVPYISLNCGEKNKLNFTFSNTGSIQKYIQASTKNVLPFLYYIYFQDEGEYNSRTDMIFAHYMFIENVYEILKISPKPFLILYTALESSWVFKEEHSIRQKRYTQTFNDTPALFAANEDLIMYIQEAIVLKIVPPIPGNISSLVLDQCSSLNMSKETFQIQMECNETIISLNYTTNDIFWSIKSITIENNDFVKLKQGQDILFYMRQISAPYGYSFHCSEIKLVENIPKSKRLLILTIRGFQVQLFDKNYTSQGSFSEAFDCSGWTTIPILSGLFISAILLMILGIGIIMILDIKLNDRFEDPKKKRTASFLIKN